MPSPRRTGRPAAARWFKNSPCFHVSGLRQPPPDNVLAEILSGGAAKTMTTLTLATSEAAVYGNSFRRRRLSRFLSIVDEIIGKNATCRILDIGGRLAYWQALEPLWRDRSCHITLINLDSEPVPDGRFSSVAGDARDLSQLDDLSFDLVHSNSVIEHVGLWREQ
jgi:hypothetical protein